MAGCEKYHEDLSAYLDGELAAAAREAVEAHLAGCERCRKALARLRRASELVAALPHARAPERLTRRVRAARSGEEAVPARFYAVRPRRFLAWVRLAGAAAAVMLAAFLVVRSTRERSGPLTPLGAGRPAGSGEANDIENGEKLAVRKDAAEGEEKPAAHLRGPEAGRTSIELDRDAAVGRVAEHVPPSPGDKGLGRSAPVTTAPAEPVRTAAVAAPPAPAAPAPGSLADSLDAPARGGRELARPERKEAAAKAVGKSGRAEPALTLAEYTFEAEKPEAVLRLLRSVAEEADGTVLLAEADTLKGGAYGGRAAPDGARGELRKAAGVHPVVAFLCVPAGRKDALDRALARAGAAARRRRESAAGEGALARAEPRDEAFRYKGKRARAAFAANEALAEARKDEPALGGAVGGAGAAEEAWRATLPKTEIRPGAGVGGGEEEKLASAPPGEGAEGARPAAAAPAEEDPAKAGAPEPAREEKTAYGQKVRAFEETAERFVILRVVILPVGGLEAAPEAAGEEP